MTVPIAELEQHFDPSVYLSLAFLFGIAAQFRVMDGYSLLRRILGRLESRYGILYAVVIVTSVFSPVILNDVLVLVLTPVLIRYSKESGADIAPLIVAEITFTNVASSVTPFGNPQNILLWQVSGISAVDFVGGTLLPLLLAGVIGALALLPLSRRMKRIGAPLSVSGSSLPAVYLALVVLTIFSADVLGVSDLLALAASFLVGFAFTYRRLHLMVDEFDLRSLLMLYALVASITLVGVVIEPLAASYAAQVVSGVQPLSASFVAILSSVISNVPTTQLLLSLTTVTAGAAPRLAVEAGLAGNIDPVASFANILALLMVRRAGIPIRKAMVLQLAVGLVAFLPAFL